MTLALQQVSRLVPQLALALQQVNNPYALHSLAQNSFLVSTLKERLPICTRASSNTSQLDSMITQDALEHRCNQGSSSL